jgi:hypothetical protein
MRQFTPTSWGSLGVRRVSNPDLTTVYLIGVADKGEARALGNTVRLVSAVLGTGSNLISKALMSEVIGAAVLPTDRNLTLAAFKSYLEEIGQKPILRRSLLGLPCRRGAGSGPHGPAH